MRRTFQNKIRTGLTSEWLRILKTLLSSVVCIFMLFKNIIFSFHFVTVKILVVTGLPYSNGINSEVIAIRTNTDKYGGAPYELYGATGGFVNNRPLVCGGYEKNYKRKKCFFLGDKNGTIVMKSERVFASGIVVHDKVSICKCKFGTSTTKLILHYQNRIKVKIVISCEPFAI